MGTETTTAAADVSVTHTSHQLNNLDIFYIIAEAVIVTVIICANTFVLFVTYRSSQIRKQSSTPFLVSLTAANLLAGIITLPTALLAHITYDEATIFCKVYQYKRHVVDAAEVYSLVSIAYNRYKVMGKAFNNVGPKSTSVDSPSSTQTEKRKEFGAPLIVSLIWTFSTLYSIPAIFLYSQKQIMDDSANSTMRDCISIGLSASLFLGFEVLILFVVPLSTICGCYVVLVRGLQKLRHPGRSGMAKSHKKVLYMCVVLVSLFCACTMPVLLLNVTVAVSGTFPDEPAVREIFELIEFSNYALNPIFYALLSDSYRHASYKMLSQSRCCGAKVRRKSSDSITQIAGMSTMPSVSRS